MKKLKKREGNLAKQRELFKGLTFFLNRETPAYCLGYLILSFGGMISTSDSPKSQITHHVMDRPTILNQQKNREYVQPQWIVDSLNNLHLLPTMQYAPGVPPPPHLSPFVDNSEEGYVPVRQKEINAIKGEDEEIEDEEEDSEEEEEEVKEEKQPEKKKEQAKETKNTQAKKQKQVKDDADSSSEDEESSDEEQ